MTHQPNPARGEAVLAGYHLRPSFVALVAAEGELGPLFALVERAAAGALTLEETVALLWHLVTGDAPERARFAEDVTAAGLAAISPVLRQMLSQILKGA